MSALVKAISLWQPWASLWLTEAKVHETRHWPTAHRGPLLVHAAKRLEAELDDELAEICQIKLGADWRSALPRGALIGVIELVSCRETSTIFPAPNDAICGDFHPGRFGWQRGAYRCFDRPIAFRGHQGIFHVATDILPERWRP